MCFMTQKDPIEGQRCVLSEEKKRKTKMKIKGENDRKNDRIDA